MTQFTGIASFSNLLSTAAPYELQIVPGSEGLPYRNTVMIPGLTSQNPKPRRDHQPSLTNPIIFSKVFKYLQPLRMQLAQPRPTKQKVSHLHVAVQA